MQTTDKTIFGRPGAKRRTSLVASALLLSLVAACGGGGEGSGESSSGVAEDDRYDLSGQSVRIGTAAEQTLDIGTSYAVELLRGWGADVAREELTDVSGLQGIIADQIDVSARSSDEVIDGQSRGVDIVAFGAPASAMHYVILGNPEIKSVADLEGKSVATSGPGGFDTVLWDALLTEEGLKRGGNVTDIPIGGSGERTAAVLAGQADASMVFLDDWISLEGKTEDVALVGYIADLLPGLSSRTLAAERSWLEENEELAVAIACANLEANQWIQEEPDAYIDFTTERVTGVAPEDVEKFRDEAMRLNFFPTAPEEVLSVDAYKATAEVMETGGLLEKDVDVDSAVDRSYLDQAAEDGCGED